MKEKRIASRLFAGLAGISAAIAIAVTVLFLNHPPILLKAPQAARETADLFLHAVCNGDFETARQYLQGTPDLGTDRKPTGAVAALVWDAMVDSSDYALKGDCYVTDTGIAQDAVFLCLELSSVTENLGDRAKLRLEEELARAESASQIYDETNGFREELVLSVLEEVCGQAIREDSRYVEREITLKLIWQDRQWWVLPEQELLNVLFGGIG